MVRAGGRLQKRSTLRQLAFLIKKRKKITVQYQSSRYNHIEDDTTVSNVKTENDCLFSSTMRWRSRLMLISGCLSACALSVPVFSYGAMIPYIYSYLWMQVGRTWKTIDLHFVNSSAFLSQSLLHYYVLSIECYFDFSLIIHHKCDHEKKTCLFRFLSFAGRKI